MRRLIAFPCEGETLVGSLDIAEQMGAAGTTGLLIVSGGNEIRAGAHRGMATLAARVAKAGYPVLRFDRRGVGDSSGENHGFRSSGPDLAAAAATFRAAANVTRIIGFGNCDAASALSLFGRAAGIDALILANPWVVEPTDDLPPAAAIRARYAERLRDPAQWRRLLTGGVSLGKLARGLARLGARAPAEGDILAAIAGWCEDVTVTLAAGDTTALAYVDAARGNVEARVMLRTASHSFADATEALVKVVVGVLSGAR